MKKGDKCRVCSTINVIWGGAAIECYEDNYGDTVEIIKETIKHDDITYYLVRNISKGYEQQVPSTILELV